MMSGTGRALVALIVDNPLRDLDGMVLLAATLARGGLDTVLVPMYDQGFDVPALRPDVVVANYVRSNNRDLLAAYRNLGIRVVVLDSEGAAGRTPQDYARMVARMEPVALVDDYCVWGRARHAALVATGALPAERVHLTGCPRYDFCAEPWSSALPAPNLRAGYILVNTNFPLPNPRFAASAEAERRTLERVWNDPDYTAAVDRDARKAFEGMLSAIEQLAVRFRDVEVVVRPHPFEATAPYEALERCSNLQVRQEGTSLQWIRACSTLVHQNCSTAVEAVMLGREPVSLEWLSTDTLRLPGPSAVSVPAGGQAELEKIVEDVRAGRPLPKRPGLTAARREVIEELFFANDGGSSGRVAQVICACLDRPPARRAPIRREARSVAVDVARRAMGYALADGFRRAARGERDVARREAKSFPAEIIGPILERILRAAGGDHSVAVSPVGAEMLSVPRLFSGKSLRISRTGQPC